MARLTFSPERGAFDRRWSDALLAACLMGVAVVGVVAGDPSNDSGDLDPQAWWEWLLVLSPSLPVAFRRSFTVQATMFSVAAQLMVWFIGLSSPFLAPLVLIYTAAAEAGSRGRRVAVGACAALIAMALLGVLVAPDVTADLLLLTALSCICAYVLGVNVADQRSAAARLAADLAVADIERSVVQERAAVAERQRVAREVHDIVGHSLSVIAVRSEAATRVGPSDPSVAIDAAEATGAIARTALADVRRVLSGLRESDSPVDLAPPASLEDLPALLAATEQVGIQINVLGDLPDPGDVSATVSISAYRLIQEALTNVIRHGGRDAVVDLRVGVTAEDLVIQVDNDRFVGSGTTTSVNGTGITGMRERVLMLGGTLNVGPAPEGGFGVRAVLPLHETHAMTGSEVGR